MQNYLLILLCILFWGSNFVISVILVREFSPLTLASIRMVFSSLFLVGYATHAKAWIRLAPRDWKYLLPAALLGIVVNQLTFYTSFQYIDATTGALIMALAPMTTAILAVFILKEPFTLRMMIGAGIALFGVFLVLGIDRSGNFSWMGALLMFLAMFSFAASIVFNRKLSDSIGSMMATVYMNLFGTMILFPLGFLMSPTIVVSDKLWAWILMICTAVVMNGICGLIWYRQIKIVGAAKGAVFLNLQPFVAMITGFLLLGTPIFLSQIFGALLIILGVVIVTMNTTHLFTQQQVVISLSKKRRIQIKIPNIFLSNR